MSKTVWIKPGIVTFEADVSFDYDAELLPGDTEDSWEIVDDETGVIYEYLKDIPGIVTDSIQINLRPVTVQELDD